jgi:hypothetical protein
MGGLGLVLDADALIAIGASVALLAGPGDRTAAPAVPAPGARVGLTA